MKRSVEMAGPPDIPDIQRVEGPVPTNAEATARSYENALLGVLTRIEKNMIAEQGKSPQYRVWEFDLETMDRHVFEHDLRPDRWVVWVREGLATDTLRVALGADVASLHAAEMGGLSRLILPGISSQIAFHNTTDRTLHIFVVAASVADFDILQITDPPFEFELGSTGALLVANTDTLVAAQDGNSNNVNVIMAADGSKRNLGVYPHLFHGSGWDRPRNNEAATLLALSARGALANSPDQINFNGKGLFIFVDVTARAAATTLQVKITGKDPVGGDYLDIWSAAVAIDTANGSFMYTIYPVGAADAAYLTTEDVIGLIPRDWRLTVTPSDGNIVTYSVAAITML